METPADPLFRDATLAVLCGGAGSRMGGPKENLTLGGEPILRRLVRRIAWRGPTLLVTAPDRPAPLGAECFDRVAPDAVAGQGPLRGTLTAIHSSATPYVVVVPLDMPNLRRELLELAIRSLHQRPELAAMMLKREATNTVEPLPLVVRSELAKPVMERRLSAGILALHALADDSLVSTIACTSVFEDTWTNLNRPSDLLAYHVEAAWGGEPIKGNPAR